MRGACPVLERHRPEGFDPAESPARRAWATAPRPAPLATPPRPDLAAGAAVRRAGPPPCWGALLPLRRLSTDRRCCSPATAFKCAGASFFWTTAKNAVNPKALALIVLNAL